MASPLSTGDYTFLIKFVGLTKNVKKGRTLKYPVFAHISNQLTFGIWRGKSIKTYPIAAIYCLPPTTETLFTTHNRLHILYCIYFKSPSKCGCAMIVMANSHSDKLSHSMIPLTKVDTKENTVLLFINNAIIN